MFRVKNNAIPYVCMYVRHTVCFMKGLRSLTISTQLDLVITILLNVK